MDMSESNENPEAQEQERFQLALRVGGLEPGLGLGEAAESLGLSLREFLTLLNEPNFLKTVRGITKAKAALALHSVGVPKLLEVIQKGKHRDALQATQILGRLSGDLKAGHTVEVRLTFEELRQRQQAGNGSQVGDLFEIKGEVIEAETTETDEDGDDANRDTT